MQLAAMQGGGRASRRGKGAVAIGGLGVVES